MLALLHYFEPSSTVFIYLACFLISKDITQRSVSPNIAASICDKKRRTRQYRHNKATFFFVALYLEGFPFSDILHTT